MAGTTTNYGWPYQQLADPPDGAALGEDLAVAADADVAAIDTRVAAVETADADASITLSSTPIQPLVSAASTDALIATVSHAFKTGFAYEISYSVCVQFNGGTSPFNAFTKIRRTNASGTVIYDPGGTAAVTSNFVKIEGSVLVKVTGGDTTQTVALIGGFSTSGSPTSMDVEAFSTRRTRLEVRRIGTAAKYTGALELPTA
jgi:hypothetical protein